MAFKNAAETIANDTNFRWSVIIAVSRAAQAVTEEDPTTLTLPLGYNPVEAADDKARQQLLHNARAVVAYKARHDPEGMGRLFAFAIISDPNNAGLNATSSDSDLQFTVNAVWDSFALGAV